MGKVQILDIGFKVLSHPSCDAADISLGEISHRNRTLSFNFQLIWPLRNFGGSAALNNSSDAGMLMCCKLQFVHFGLFPYLSVSDRTRKRLKSGHRRQKPQQGGQEGPPGKILERPRLLHNTVPGRGLLWKQTKMTILD